MSSILGNIVKIVLSVLLLPVVIASSVSFYNHIQYYERVQADFFVWGSIGFLIVFLFLHQFWGLFDFGQKVLGFLFKFMSPVDSVIVRIIPFYVTLTMVAFYLLKSFTHSFSYDPYFMFFAGFSLSMHILLNAQDLQQQESRPVKPAYLFWMSLIFISNLIIVVLLFNLVWGKFTFPDYVSDMVLKAEEIYSMLFLRVSN